MTGEKTFYEFVIVAFTILEIIGDIFVEQRSEIDRMWLSILLIALIIYTFVRFLKTRTKILEVQGNKML